MEGNLIDALITFLNDAGEAFGRDSGINKQENPFYITVETIQELRQTNNKLTLENRVLKERMQHLLKSKIVRSYDIKDRRTGQYELNIDEFDERYGEK